MAAAAIALGPMADAGPVFLRNLADVPLMPGLVEKPAQGMVFDTTEGRVVEAVAEGRGVPAAVRDYYAEALPELGWSVDKSAPDPAYRRGSEVLSINATNGAKSSVSVHFVLRPAPKP